MIHQCYFAEAQRVRLFQTPVYCGFGLEPEVNPDLARNCPELQEARNRPLLCEYAALLHLWRNPELDPDPWAPRSHAPRGNARPAAPRHVRCRVVRKCENAVSAPLSQGP